MDQNNADPDKAKPAFSKGAYFLGKALWAKGYSEFINAYETLGDRCQGFWGRSGAWVHRRVSVGVGNDAGLCSRRGAPQRLVNEMVCAPSSLTGVTRYALIATGP